MGRASGRFDLIIFDLDGTLVDSVPDIAWALNETLAEAGFPSFPVAAVRNMVGDGAAQLVARAVPAATDEARAAHLVTRFMSHYGAHLAVDTTLYPGILELLEQLHRSGIMATVLTNKPSQLARRLLAEMNILSAFERVIGDGDGHPRKPDPGAAHELISRLAPAPSRVVVVGDGLPDVRMARAIPCPSIAATWGYVPEEQLRGESPTWLAGSVPALAALLL
jgi:phosphoglycolate phosphatase